jgi:hypothetical protein
MARISRATGHYHSQASIVNSSSHPGADRHSSAECVAGQGITGVVPRTPMLAGTVRRAQRESVGYDSTWQLSYQPVTHCHLVPQIPATRATRGGFSFLESNKFHIRRKS